MASLIDELREILAAEFSRVPFRNPAEFCDHLQERHEELYARLVSELPHLPVSVFFGAACRVLEVPELATGWFCTVVRILQHQTPPTSGALKKSP